MENNIDLSLLVLAVLVKHPNGGQWQYNYYQQANNINAVLAGKVMLQAIAVYI